MTRLNFLFILVAVVAVATVTSFSQAANAIDAGRSSAFIEKLGNDAVGMVSNEALSQDEKSRQFRGLLQQSFALKPIARFVLGRYWKQADDRQRERYVLLFEDYIVQSYSARFGEYAGETFRIIDEKPEGNSGTVVTTMIMRPQGEPVEVQWFVREHKGELKIVDVVIEGISMSLTQRSDFAAAIRKNGGDINAFLDSLEAVSKAN